MHGVLIRRQQCGLPQETTATSGCDFGFIKIAFRLACLHLSSFVRLVSFFYSMLFSCCGNWKIFICTCVFPSQPAILMSFPEIVQHASYGCENARPTKQKT